MSENAGTIAIEVDIELGNLRRKAEEYKREIDELRKEGVVVVKPGIDAEGLKKELETKLSKVNLRTPVSASFSVKQIRRAWGETLSRVRLTAPVSITISDGEVRRASQRIARSLGAAATAVTVTPSVASVPPVVRTPPQTHPDLSPQLVTLPEPRQTHERRSPVSVAEKLAERIERRTEELEVIGGRIDPVNNNLLLNEEIAKREAAIVRATARAQALGMVDRTRSDVTYPTSFQIEDAQADYYAEKQKVEADYHRKLMRERFREETLAEENARKLAEKRAVADERVAQRARERDRKVADQRARADVAAAERAAKLREEDRLSRVMVSREAQTILQREGLASPVRAPDTVEAERRATELRREAEEERRAQLSRERRDRERARERDASLKRQDDLRRRADARRRELSVLNERNARIAEEARLTRVMVPKDVQETLIRGGLASRVVHPQMRAANERVEAARPRGLDAFDPLKMRSSGYYKFASGATMSAMTIAPVIAATKKAADAAISFEDAFAGVRRTVIGTEEELETIRKQLREMASGRDAVPVSFEELSALAENAGQLGIETPKIVDFTRIVSTLGVTTNMSAEQASTGLAKFANITGMSQDKFDNLASVLVGLGTEFASTEADLLNMALRIAGAGTQVGMTEGQVMALAAAMSSLGLRSDAGGSATSKAIQEMAKAVATGSENLEGFAKVSKMSVEDFSDLFREDAAKALMTFISGLRDARDEGKDVFGMLDNIGLGALRTTDAMNRASGGVKLLNDAMSLQETLWGNANAHILEAERRFETTANKIKVFQQRVKEVSASLTEAALPAIGDVAERVGNYLPASLFVAQKAWEDMGSAGQLAIKSIGGLAIAAGPLQMIIGMAQMMTASLGGIGKSLAGIMKLGTGAGWGNILAFLAANPVALAGVAAAITAIGLAARTTAGVMKDLAEAKERADESMEDAFKTMLDSSYIDEKEIKDTWAELKREVADAKGDAEKMEEVLKSLTKFEEKIKLKTETDLIEVLRDDIEKAKGMILKAKEELSSKAMTSPIWVTSMNRLFGLKDEQKGPGDAIKGYFDLVGRAIGGYQEMQAAARQAEEDMKAGNTADYMLNFYRNTPEGRKQAQLESFQRRLARDEARKEAERQAEIERKRQGIVSAAGQRGEKAVGNTLGTDPELSAEELKRREKELEDARKRAHDTRMRQLREEQSVLEQYNNILEGTVGRIAALGEKTEEAKVRNELLKRSLDNVSASYKQQAIEVAKLYDEMEKLTGLKDSLEGLISSVQDRLISRGQFTDPNQGILDRIEKSLGYRERVTGAITKARAIGDRIGDSVYTRGRAIDAEDEAFQAANSQIGADTVALARSLVGKTGKDARVTGAAYGLEWCVGFIQQVRKELGQSPLAKGTLSVSAVRAAAQKDGTAYRGMPQVGDYATFKNVGKTRSHIAIVSKVNADGTFETIGGNEGSKNNYASRVREGAKYDSKHPGVLFVRSGGGGAGGAVAGGRGVVGAHPGLSEDVQRIMRMRPDVSGSLGRMREMPEWMRRAWGEPVKDTDENAALQLQGQQTIFSKQATEYFLAIGEKAATAIIKDMREYLQSSDAGVQAREQAVALGKKIKDYRREIFLIANEEDPFAEIRHRLAQGEITYSGAQTEMALERQKIQARAAMNHQLYMRSARSVRESDAAIMAPYMSGEIAYNRRDIDDAMDRAEESRRIRSSEDYQQLSRAGDIQGAQRIWAQQMQEWLRSRAQERKADDWMGVQEMLGSEVVESQLNQYRRHLEDIGSAEDEINDKLAARTRYYDVLERYGEEEAKQAEKRALAESQLARQHERRKALEALDYQSNIATTLSQEELRAGYRHGFGSGEQDIEVRLAEEELRLTREKSMSEEELSRHMKTRRRDLEEQLRIRRVIAFEEAKLLGVEENSLIALEEQLTLEGKRPEEIQKAIEKKRDEIELSKTYTKEQAEQLARLREENRLRRESVEIQARANEVRRQSRLEDDLARAEMGMIQERTPSAQRDRFLRQAQEYSDILNMQDGVEKDALLEAFRDRVRREPELERMREEDSLLTSSSESLARLREEVEALGYRTELEREYLDVEHQVAELRRRGVDISSEVIDKLREEASARAELREYLKEYEAFQRTADAFGDSLVRNLEKSGFRVKGILRGMINDLADYTKSVALEAAKNKVLEKIFPGANREDVHYRVKAPSPVGMLQDVGGDWRGTVMNVAANVMGGGGFRNISTGAAGGSMNAQNVVIHATTAHVNSAAQVGGSMAGAPTGSQRIFGIVSAGLGVMTRNGVFA